jgi:hypothetical protein
MAWARHGYAMAVMHNDMPAAERALNEFYEALARRDARRPRPVPYRPKRRR